MVVQDKPNYRDISQSESGSNDRKQQRLRERFEVVNKLGQGTYGKVQLAVNKETKQEVAIKTIKKAKIENEQDLVRIRREIQIMSSIHHPHIIHIYEVFENQEKIVLIMQYASGGELYDYLGCRKKLDENEARRVFRQVASAIFYCHKNRICHRDLKLENILLDNRGNAKIADFGLSNVFDERYKLKTFCGSPLYASPEIVRGTPYCGPEVDCWSLGVLLYTLVYGAMPFDGSNFKRLVKQISEGEYFEPKEKSGASGLIRRLLTVDISLRATIRDICTDWWVNQGYDHSLLKVASDMANLTPVRQDLLMAISSTSCQAAGISVKNQTATSTKPAENRNILSNGYYSRSHPLHVPENGESRRRTLATADGCRVNNSSTAKDGKLQIIGVAGNSEKLEDELNSHKNGCCLPFVDAVKTCTVKTPTDDKNENNTFIIVQDLIKDVIYKVEQHINNSKMELLRSAETKLSQEKPSEEHITIDNNSLKGKDIIDTSEEAPRFKVSQSPTSEEDNSLLQKTKVTAEETVSQNIHSDSSRSFTKHSTAINAMVQTAKIEGVSSELGAKYFPEKTVQLMKSIPSKNCDLQGRKSSIQLMEPDLVIPIFNVCSNIPKRSLDSVKPSSTNAKLKPNLQSTTSKFSESKNTDCNTKLNNESSSENKVIACSPGPDISQVSSADSREMCEFKSQIRNGCSVTLQNRTVSLNSASGKAVVDTQELSTDTEIPKLPPRRRFLVKIPKLEKSNEKDVARTHSESNDFNITHTCDKKEDGELDLQQESKDFGFTSSTDEKNKSPSVGPEENSSLTVNKEANVESGAILSQRKSRRDSSKRCLSFNSKLGINREQIDDISEKRNGSGSRTEDQGTMLSISAKELEDLPSVKHNDINEVLKDGIQLPVSSTECDNILTPDDICPNSPTENKSLTLHECFDTISQGKKIEQLETKTENLDLSGKNSDILEMEMSFRNVANERQNMKRSNSSDVENNSRTPQQREAESRRSRPLVRSKHRSLSRTRAMSLEFESLALMPVKIIRPPQKPPGKVEIPKNFDPTQPKVTSPKTEMREIIFIPTACVSENKEKIQKKIEKVRRAAIIIPPRRKSDAGISSQKKKYTRSKTDFIVRPNDLATFSEDTDLTINDEQHNDAVYREIYIQNGEVYCQENIDGETVSNEMWYSAVSPDIESEESEQRFKTFGECADSYEILYIDNDVTDNENSKLHRHSVDAESGYWTPPEMNMGENSTGQTTVQIKTERHHKRGDNTEKLMLQRAAFRNSKMRMKLSDEGLDMCSLSSSLESGIYSWRQEEINGKRISPDGESTLKVLSPMKFAEMTMDGSYPPIARSFKKMTFPPEHSSTSELSENCSIVGDAEKNVNTYIAAPGGENPISQRMKPNGDTKPIKPSDSQSSYGSNDISDDVFESWVERENVRTSKNASPGDTEKGSTLNAKKNSVQGRKAKNWQRGEAWHSYSTDKESSDNDDDLDLMIDESCQGVYGTEGLWQFLKSVNQNLSNQLQTASKKMSPKPLCHRSKSQESKHPDDLVSQKRPVTRSLSREEKQRKGGTQMRHFVSEGKLADADSMDCFEDSYTHFDDTRYSSGYMASGSSINDCGMVQKDFMSSADSFNSHSNDISIYGTLRKDKYFQSASALSSPCVTRRKKNLQHPYSSVDMLNLSDNAVDISNDDMSKVSPLTEQNRKLSLYGTLRNRHLSQQGKAQSQILLSTDDGYQLLYNERPKKDVSLETRHGSLGTLSSSASKASSELNVSLRENTIKDYEKLLLSDPKNLLVADSTYHMPRDKASSTVKKIVSDKGNRRVSFSSDVKTSKNDYHSSLRQNSLNKVREANEELLSTSHHKSNTYEEEQDSGSLLEALKTYGYKGIMSQKLQTTSDRYEPRLNYRLPTEYLLSAGVCNTDWDNFEYIPVENTFAYQQAMYSPLDTMEYYPNKTCIRSSQIKRNIGPLSCDDDVTFDDILRSHRLSEDDFFCPRKPVHKIPDRSDLHLTNKDKYACENWDANPGSSVRKKNFDGPTVTLSGERRNSGSEKVLKSEREREKEGLGSTDVSEPRGSKQMENSIEILSEKIQALKSRCQRKPSDENKVKKDLDDSGVVANESKGKEKIPGSEVDNERLHGHADSADDLAGQEGESSESVSDRIWRKSFYSRFNDVSTTRRKKPSIMDSEFLSGYNSLRGTGKFNVDEEGGVEEPWINTTLKRRNSRRSIPRQTVARASSLNSDAGAVSDCSSMYHKRGTSLIETGHKTSRTAERTKFLSQSSREEQSTSAVCDKTVRPSKDELGNTNKIGRNRLNTTQTMDSCDIKEKRMVTTKSKENKTSTNELETDTNDLTSNCSPRNTMERIENLARKLEPVISLTKGTENIPETDIREDGSVASDSDIRDISADEPKNATSLPDDFSSPSEKSKMTSEPISDKPKVEDKALDSTSADAIDTQENRPGMDKE